MAPMPTDKVSSGHRQCAPDPLAEAAPAPAVSLAETTKALEQAATAPVPTPAPVASAVAAAPRPVARARCDEPPPPPRAKVRVAGPASVRGTTAPTSAAPRRPLPSSRRVDPVEPAPVDARPPSAAAAPRPPRLRPRLAAAAPAPAEAAPAAAAAAPAPAPAESRARCARPPRLRGRRRPAARRESAPAPDARRARSPRPLRPRPSPRRRRPRTSPRRPRRPSCTTRRRPRRPSWSSRRSRPRSWPSAPTRSSTAADLPVADFTTEEAPAPIAPITVDGLEAPIAVSRRPDRARAARHDAGARAEPRGRRRPAADRPRGHAADREQAHVGHGHAGGARDDHVRRGEPVRHLSSRRRRCRANAARGPPTLEDFNQLLAGLGQVISTLGTLKEYAGLAKDLPLIGESVGTFTKFIDGIQATYDLISAYIASHPAPRLDEIAALLLGRIDNPSVTPVTDETQIALQITHRGSQSTSLPLSLGTADRTWACRSTAPPRSPARSRSTTRSASASTRRPTASS